MFCQLWASSRSTADHTGSCCIHWSYPAVPQGTWQINSIHSGLVCPCQLICCVVCTHLEAKPCSKSLIFPRILVGQLGWSSEPHWALLFNVGFCFQMVCIQSWLKHEFDILFVQFLSSPTQSSKTIGHYKPLLWPDKGINPLYQLGVR